MVRRELLRRRTCQGQESKPARAKLQKKLRKLARRRSARRAAGGQRGRRRRSALRRGRVARERGPARRGAGRRRRRRRRRAGTGKLGDSLRSWPSTWPGGRSPIGTMRARPGPSPPDAKPRSRRNLKAPAAAQAAKAAKPRPRRNRQAAQGRQAGAGRPAFRALDLCPISSLSQGDCAWPADKCNFHRGRGKPGPETASNSPRHGSQPTGCSRKGTPRKAAAGRRMKPASIGESRCARDFCETVGRPGFGGNPTGQGQCESRGCSEACFDEQPAGERRGFGLAGNRNAQAKMASLPGDGSRAWDSGGWWRHQPPFRLPGYGTPAGRLIPARNMR